VLCEDEGLDEEIVKENLRRMLQFRLIEAVEPDENAMDIGFTTYRILPNAAVLMDIVKSSPDVLTYLALGAVLPAQHSKRIFRNTNLSLEYKDHVELVIPVVLKFSVYINALSKSRGGSNILVPENYFERLNVLLERYDGAEKLIDSVSLLR